MKHTKYTALFLAVILLFALFAGCSASMKSYDRAAGANEEAQYSKAEESEAESAVSGSPAEEPAAEADSAAGDKGLTTTSIADAGTRKLIFNGTLTIETLKFDQSLDLIEQMVAGLGGYVESSSVASGNDYIIYEDGKRDPLRYATFVLRIPADKFGGFMDGSDNIGHVLSSATSANDISSTYYDTQARLESLKIMEERLLELLRKSETLTDAIQLEKSLADTRYEIENLTGTLKKYDDMVSYSTVTLYLNEVVEETEIDVPEAEPETLGGRIVARLGKTFEDIAEGGADFIVWFIASLPYIVIWLGIAFLIYLGVRAIVKKSGRMSEPRTPTAAPRSPSSGSDDKKI